MVVDSIVTGVTTVSRGLTVLLRYTLQKVENPTILKYCFFLKFLRNQQSSKVFRFHDIVIIKAFLKIILEN